MSVKQILGALERIEGKVDVLLSRGTEAPGGPGALTLRAGDIDADGAWRPAFLAEIDRRVQQYGVADAAKLQGFGGVVVSTSTAQLGGGLVSRNDKVVRVPRGIMATAVAEQADAAGELLDERQIANIYGSVSKAGFAIGAEIAPAYSFSVGADGKPDLTNFLIVQGVVTIRGGLTARSLSDVKAIVVRNVETQLRECGITDVDLSGV